MLSFNYISICSLLLCTVSNQLCWASENIANQVVPKSEHDEKQINSNLLYQIPAWIDAAPTLLPEQSDQAIVPSTSETENRSWIDKKQKIITDWADQTSIKIDNLFGHADDRKTASASLRVLIDNTWNKYDGYEIKPRIRGKIKLPTLEKKLSLVFGDDSLDNELNNNIIITNENEASTSNKRLDAQQTRESNGSVALRWSQLSKRLPFETDFDIGLRSGDDIYARLKAKKDWQLDHDFKFHAEQIYRYGLQSKNYLRTNFELTQSRPQHALLSDQLSLTYSDHQDDDLSWDNLTFRQHQFFKANAFSYGMYTGGFFNNKDLRLNSWGPFMSWRQPFLREWFFIQGDLNYLNDHRAGHSHNTGASLRLEALF